MKNRTNFFNGPVLIIIAALLWALDGMLRRHLYSLPPINIIFFEHLVGLVILLPFSWKFLNKEKFGYKDWVLLGAIAIFSGLLGTLWFTTALLRINFISFSVVFLLQKLQPIFAISSARVFLKEKISKQFIPWAVLAIVSAYFVTFKNGIVNLSTGDGTVIAALYALGASFAWGTSTTFSKMLLNKVNTRAATFYRFLFTTILTFFVIVFHNQSFNFSVPTVPQWGLFLLIALSTGMLALYIYYKGLSKTKVHISTILELTFPFIAIMIDMFIYDNYLSISQWVATIILVFSIYKVIKIQQSYANTQ